MRITVLCICLLALLASDSVADCKSKKKTKASDPPSAEEEVVTAGGSKSRSFEGLTKVCSRVEESGFTMETLQQLGVFSLERLKASSWWSLQGLAYVVALPLLWIIAKIIIPK